MFLNITADNWVLLWSAVIGAVVAGGTAATVALWVLKRTKEHQSEIAALQLAEQRKDLDQQLRLQQEGLDAQLKEQRDEASKARRHAAMGDLVGAVERGLNRYKQLEHVEVCFEEVASAIGRWSIDSDDNDLQSELSRWPYLLYNILREARIEHASINPDPAPFERLLATTSALSTTATRWAREAPEARGTIPKMMAGIRADMEEGSAAYRAGKHGEFAAGIELLKQS